MHKDTLFTLIICHLYLFTFAFPPELILYNKRGSEGEPTYVATTNIEINNQVCLPEQIKATRVCATAGAWILYPETSFKSSSGATFIVNNACRDLPPYLNRQVGSYRYIGNGSESSASSLNLYVTTYYRETETKTSASLPSLPLSFNSLIRTGPEQWQFYMKESYSGFSECLDPDEYYVPNFEDRFNVKPGDIKSIRQGCDKI